MTVEKEYSILYEAYTHYQKTGDKHFEMTPKNEDYVQLIISTVPTMRKKALLRIYPTICLTSLMNLYALFLSSLVQRQK